MDPDEALDQLLGLIEEYRRVPPWEPVKLADLADRIVSRIEELDGWLSKGGFPPARWAR